MFHQYFLFALLFFVAPICTFAQSYDVEIFASVPGCGNEIIESPEQCDGANLGGSSCKLLGFSSGALSCSSVCTHVTASCVLSQPQGGGTQLGLGNQDIKPSILSSNLVVTGYTAPGSRVSLLKDGVISATAFADQNGYFQITLSGLTPGAFLLKLSAANELFKPVMTESFFGMVYKDSTTKISGISLAPFSVINQSENNQIISIKTAPDSRVLAEFNGKTYEGLTDNLGNYNFNFEEKFDSYRVGLLLNGETVWSPYYETKSLLPINCALGIDMTEDCRVNFIDFAITLWWYIYNRAESQIDFDGNGRLDLVDFSIMAYYWTG